MCDRPWCTCETYDAVEAERDEAQTALAGILVALGIDLPVPVGAALEVALNRIEALVEP